MATSDADRIGYFSLLGTVGLLRNEGATKSTWDWSRVIRWPLRSFAGGWENTYRHSDGN